MNEKKKREKLLAVQEQTEVKKKELVPAECRRLEIPYITKEMRVEYRPMQLFLPKGAEGPLPLVFVAHYGITEDAAETQACLRRGWAVSSVADFTPVYSEKLTDDNLVFNNAALYALRNLPEIDPDRVAVTGGSAGGYTALMLGGLHLGLCGVVANCPVTNVHFNFHVFFPAAYELFKESRAALSEEEKQEARRLTASTDMEEKLRGLSMTKFPILATIAKCFLCATNNFPDPEDAERCAALSPIGLAKCFSNPVVVDHYTSDALVPVDQISRRFTYPRPGDSLPQTFAAGRLPDPPRRCVDYSFEELLPPELTQTYLAPEPTESVPVSFDPEKPFALNIYDEGPMESSCGHRRLDGKGGANTKEFLAYCIEKGASKTGFLSPAKLEQMLLRCAGESVPLPPREGVDDAVYGSLAMYRKEVREELSRFAAAHGAQAVSDALDALLSAKQGEERARLARLAEEALR